jgi:WD40 repeat protein
MSVVESTRVEDHWALRQTYPLWKELPTDVTCKQVLPLLDPSDHSCCSVVCKQWNRFLTSDSVWLPLSSYHFPSLSPGFLKSFQVYQRLYSNSLKGVCSVKTLRGHCDTVSSLVLKDAMLFSGSCDNTIKIWDLGANNTCTATLAGHTDLVYCLALRDATLFSGSYDNTIKIWDLNSPTKTCTATLNGHTDWVQYLAIRDATLFSSSFDNTIKIWDLRDPNNTCTATLKEHTGEIYSLAVRDEMLFSSSADNTIKIWDLATNTCTATLKDTARSLALKDTMLISGSFDKNIKIWDLGDNTCMDTLCGHTGVVVSLAVRDEMLISGSSDHTIKIWDLRTRTCTATLKGHTNVVRALVLRDATLFSGSVDNTIKIWDFAANHVEIFMQIADAFDGRGLREAEFAMDRFSKMPSAAKNKIFNELYEIIKPKLKPDDQRSAEDIFYGKIKQSAANFQRTEAIKNYLAKLPKT